MHKIQDNNSIIITNLSNKRQKHKKGLALLGKKNYKESTKTIKERGVPVKQWREML